MGPCPGDEKQGQDISNEDYDFVFVEYSGLKNTKINSFEGSIKLFRHYPIIYKHPDI